jgi:hypothetical protein
MRKFWLLVCIAACGGSDAAPAPDAAVPDAEVFDAAPCNTIEDVATADVVEVGLAEDPPTPTGGAIADGTYVITNAVYYTGAGGQTGETGVVYHSTSVNAAGTYQYIDTGSGPVRTSGIYETSNVSDVSVIQQCPPGGLLNFHQISATPTEFTLFAATPAGTQALTFTLVP